MRGEYIFNVVYGELASSDKTIGCTRCGTTLFGDGPSENIVCVQCLEEFSLGIQLKDAVFCTDCAIIEAPFFTEGHPVTYTSHPDGFTCCSCGDVITPERSVQ